jgi:hypothetical protein
VTSKSTPLISSHVVIVTYRMTKPPSCQMPDIIAQDRRRTAAIATPLAFFLQRVHIRLANGFLYRPLSPSAAVSLSIQTEHARLPHPAGSKPK